MYKVDLIPAEHTKIHRVVAFISFSKQVLSVIFFHCTEQAQPGR